MLDFGHKKWYRFDEHLWAVHASDAYQLKAWHRAQEVNAAIGQYFEWANFRNHKIISKEHKVQAALTEKRNVPFNFFLGLN